MTDEKTEQLITQLGPDENGVADGEVTPGEGVADKTVPEGAEQAKTDDAGKEEELRKELSFIKGRHQQMVGVLKKYGTDFYNEVKGQLQEPPQEPVVAPPTEEAAEEYVDPSIRRLESRLDRVTELLTGQAEQQQVKEKHAEEYAVSDQELSKFLAANRFPSALVERARTIMAGMPGIDVSKPGGPSAYVDAMGTVLTQLAEFQHTATPATPATPAEKTLAERQARDMALASQPGGAPSPMGGPSKDENEKAADDIASDFTEGGVFS